jgi:uncharacterized membrane protein
MQLIWGGLLFGLGFWFALIFLVLFFSVLIFSWVAMHESAAREKAFREEYEKETETDIDKQKGGYAGYSHLQ